MLAAASNLNSSKASEEFIIPVIKEGGMTSVNFYRMTSEQSPLKAGDPMLNQHSKLNMQRNYFKENKEAARPVNP